MNITDNVEKKAIVDRLQSAGLITFSEALLLLEEPAPIYYPIWQPYQWQYPNTQPYYYDTNSLGVLEFN